MKMPSLPREARDVLNIALPEAALPAFERYAELLVEWSRRFNLTAIRDREGIRTRHFLDSLSCLAVMPEPSGRIVDVGAGAGFPGLVLKIARPAIRLTLVESVSKKAAFCRRVVEELGLEGVEVLAERAEDLGRDPAHREQYDWAVARALAAMPVLAEYLLPLLRVGGRMLAMKGEGGLAEGGDAGPAFETLGGQLTAHQSFELPGAGEKHLLLVVEKTSPTPERYPRRPGIPSKRPIGGR